ncbi:DUF3885 domain-containing protein [Paenibacillus sp. NPDC058071]|uniref:DUF3885 domain-containing protein n=1 Tax=Paenibacillus sp. NPDC058071 TaxID=3346326 RepID=UPI0036D837F4
MKDFYSNRLQLESPLFYNADFGIRFEIGNPDPSVSDEAYEEQVHHRALALFKDVHQADDDILIVVNVYLLRKGIKPVRRKVFDHSFRNPQVLRSLNCVSIHKADDEEDEGWESYQYVLQCKASDLKHHKILFNPHQMFIINRTRHTIFYFYDNRGLDIVSHSRDALQELYLKRNDWILNYDRESIDAIFK